MSEANSGGNNPMYGKSGALNPMYGKTHTPETRAQMSDSQSAWLLGGCSDLSPPPSA